MLPIKVVQYLALSQHGGWAAGAAKDKQQKTIQESHCNPDWSGRQGGYIRKQINLPTSG